MAWAGIIFSQYWTFMYQKIVKKSKKVVRGTLYEKCTVLYSFHKVYNVTKEFRDFVLSPKKVYRSVHFL